MYIKTLTLTNFRNYRRAELEFIKGTNIICGDNAQGKTNLLEAVYLFARGKSYRTRSDKELISFLDDDVKAARAVLTFHAQKRDFTGEINIISGGRKIIRMNSVPVTKLSALLSRLNVVMFAPEDLNIIKNSPSVRRSFMDAAICQMYPPYLVALTEYNRALSQKNALLKQLKKSGKMSDGTLSVWNGALAESGEKIMKARGDFIKRLSENAGVIYSEMGKEKLSMRYTPDCADGDLYARFENAMQREIENGSSLTGIQRDDIDFLLDEKQARVFGSQGQQRSAVLAVKLAQCEYIKSERGEYPVLLLDDVMSELDAHRRAYLSDRIRDKQVIITCTDIDEKTAQSARIFNVNGGRVNVHSSGQ